MARYGAQFGPDLTFLGVPRCDWQDPATFPEPMWSSSAHRSTAAHVVPGPRPVRSAVHSAVLLPAAGRVPAGAAGGRLARPQRPRRGRCRDVLRRRGALRPRSPGGGVRGSSARGLPLVLGGHPRGAVRDGAAPDRTGVGSGPATAARTLITVSVLSRR